MCGCFSLCMRVYFLFFFGLFNCVSLCVSDRMFVSFCVCLFVCLFVGLSVCLYERERVSLCFFLFMWLCDSVF